VLESYAILDIETLAYNIRKESSEIFCQNHNTDLEGYITLNQVISLIKEKSLGENNDGFYLINDKIYCDIFKSVATMLYEVSLSRLAAANLIDSAWDSDKNKMIFWTKGTNLDFAERSDSIN
jgi:hypothetical protein